MIVNYKDKWWSYNEFNLYLPSDYSEWKITKNLTALYTSNDNLVQIELTKIQLIQKEPIVYRFDGPLKFKFMKDLSDNKVRLEFVVDLLKAITS